MVRLGGDMLNTHPKENVTPAEFVILQAAHGHDAVSLVPGTIDEKKHNRAETVDYLRRQYRLKAEGTCYFDKLFPGAFPNLPIRFAEIGLGEIDAVSSSDGRIESEAVTLKASPRGKKASAKAKQLAAEVEAELAAERGEVTSGAINPKRDADADEEAGIPDSGEE